MAATLTATSAATGLDDAVLFENRDWILSEDGLEHRATGYFIARGSLGAKRPDGYWDWPLHLSEKAWCGVRSFREAFLAALQAFGIAPDPKLTLSFALGFGTRLPAPETEGFVPLADLVRLAPPPRRRAAAARAPRALALGA
ncbi:conserved hypothetical protein [Methylobacterium sp. 4-46]|uniref:hypothetical protein n=1 Tax=unclassified Methylobacterium TaxID=2615210 RepID=UPI000152CBFF|nr:MULTISPECIES: hypothetical protein [Methylobacterium]ACA20552.1 conserved hypothetical protein [Methylobacterium sp. 4-46]WFT79719.1 hypothetical protein QA634_31755 [Methylobacterium nodulans]